MTSSLLCQLIYNGQLNNRVVIYKWLDMGQSIYSRLAGHKQIEDKRLVKGYRPREHDHVIVLT